MKPTKLFRATNYTLDSTSGWGSDNRRARRLMRRARGRETAHEIAGHTAPDLDGLRVPVYEAMHDEDDHTWGYAPYDWQNDTQPLRHSALP